MPLPFREAPVEAASVEQAIFRCPRCEGEYSLRLVVSRWSEWGVLCWCPERGVFDLACFADYPTVAAPT